MIIAGLIGDCYNRRTFLFAFIIISRSAFLLAALFPLDVVSNIFLSVGIISLSIEVYFLFLCTGEIYSTFNRGIAFGYCNFIGRLGGAFASTFIILAKNIGIVPIIFIVFITLTSLISIYFIEETRDTQLKEIEKDGNSQELNLLSY